MFFRQFLHEELSCLSYFVGCSSKGVVAVVDPQVDIDHYVEIAKEYNLRISHIVETHVQADHLSGAQALSYQVKAPVYYHQLAPVKFPHQKLADGEILEIGNRTIRVIHTPGHTDESITLFVDNWFALTGDTLFVGDVGRVDLTLEKNPDEILDKAKKLHSSLFGRLLKLPDHIEIYPGHYGGSSCGKHMDGKPISTIGREKRLNNALQVTSRQQFIAKLTKDTPPLPTNFRQIKRKNMGI